MGNQHIVAIDIGQTAVRAAEAKIGRGGEIEIRAYREELIPVDRKSVV